MRLFIDHFCLVYFPSLLITKHNDFFLILPFPVLVAYFGLYSIRRFLELKSSLKIISKSVFLP